MYCIVPVDRQPVADLVSDRLRRLLLSIYQGSLTGDELPYLHVFDSANEVKLVSPGPQARSISGDWVNENHRIPPATRSWAPR
jgi:hypothetical protein